MQALKVKHIVVLGHAQCGGIRAFVEEAKPLSPGDFIGHWMALIAPAARKSVRAATARLANYLTQLEQASVVKMLDNLMTFPWVRKRSSHGTSGLARRLFRCRHRAAFGARPATGRFVQVAAEDYARMFTQPRF